MPAKKARKKASSKPAVRKPAATRSRLTAGAKAEEWRHEPTKGLYGWITHTELASTDPDATKVWAAKALGWTFMPSFPMEDGEPYHLFAYSEKGGGGIRRNNPPEPPGSIPYVHVDDVAAWYRRALAAGAKEMVKPTKVMEGVVTAIVLAPGNVAVGFSGGK